MIKHLEDLKPKDLLYFIKNWNNNKSKFIITEKMDGNAMSFGLMKEKFYLSSKSKTFLYEEDISDAYFMKDFKRYFKALKELPLKNIKSILEKYNLSYSDSFEIDGEAIPTHDHNIIIYNPEKILNGTFIIFGIKLDDVEIINYNLIKDITQELNKHDCQISFYKVPKVSIDSFHINESIIDNFEKIITKFSSVLEKPARSLEDKALKQKIISFSNKVGLKIKKDFLKHMPNSFFGEECEGLVFLIPNKFITKIVNKEKYTATKEKNWFFISKLILLQTKYKKKLKENPILVADINLVNEWEKELIEIENNFNEMHKNYITINRKFEDTKNEISLQRDTLNSIKNYIETKDIENIKNIFSLVNSAVPIELLQKNLDVGLEKIGFKNLNYKVVGNLNKKFVGDIDVAIDFKEISKIIKSKAYPGKKFWTKLHNYLTSQNVKFRIFEGFSQFHIVLPLLNEENKRLNAFHLYGEQKLIPGTIQIDFFVGDLTWMSSVLSGAPIESNYKAAHRNLLLNSIFSSITWKSSKNEEIFNKLKIGRDGFRLIQKNLKKKSLVYKTFSNNPDLVAKVLFKTKNSWSDIDSYEKLYALIISDEFKYKRLLPVIFKDFQLILHSSHQQLPKEFIQK